MKIVRTFLLVLTMIAACVSCCKSDYPIHKNGGNVTFACNGGTKASSSSTIEDVKTLDLLIFRKDDGVLEYYTRVNGDEASVNVTTGISYLYYVVANAPQNVLNHCATVSDFCQTVWPLSDISGGIAMTGSGENKFKDNDTVVVGLNRLPAKVTLEGITPLFLGKSFLGSTVKLERVYIINVNGSCLYCGTACSGSTWYNKLQTESLSPELTGYLIATPFKTISGPEKITDVFSFLCCPNPINNGVTSLTEPVWSERNTRLVIEISIDGVLNYYPIDMPSMACNTSYIVKDAILLGPGSSSPDIPVSRNSLSFSVTVNPWIIDTEKTITF